MPMLVILIFSLSNHPALKLYDEELKQKRELVVEELYVMLQSMVFQREFNKK